MSSSPFVDKPDEAPDDVDSPVRSVQRPQSSQKVTSVSTRKMEEEIVTLRYQLSTSIDERERDKVRYESSIRELENKVKTEGQRADSLESDQLFLFEKQKEIADTLERARQEFDQERQQMQSTMAELRTKCTDLETQLADQEASARSTTNRLQTQISDVEAERDNFASTFDDLNGQVANLNEQLSAKQKTIVEQAEEIDQLKSSNFNLKHLESQQESADIVRNELKEQVEYIHKLEAQIESLNSQLKRLTEDHQLVEIVREEKAALEVKLRSLQEAQESAASNELLLLQLQQEKQRWASFLEKDDSYSTPEDIVRALMHERVEKAGLLDQLGRAEADYSAERERNEALSKQLEDIRDQLTEAKDQHNNDLDNITRLENQKQLAVKEATMLREQLKSYDDEEKLAKDQYDETKSQRIDELERLLDSSRKELDTISKQLSKKESEITVLNSPAKRRRSEDHGDRISESLRKIRGLQVELDRTKVQLAEKTKEIEAYERRVASLEEAGTTRHRILQLRDNPTSRHEAIKASMLKALQKENEALLGQQKAAMVPVSTVDRLREEIKELERDVQEQKKSKERLSTVYKKLSTELRQTVYSLLGYQVDPQPNKKVKVKSMFATSEDEVLTFAPDTKSKEKKFILIDDSPYTKQHENLVTFWIKERNDVPSFLSALTLELYDQTTKARRF